MNDTETEMSLFIVEIKVVSRLFVCLGFLFGSALPSHLLEWKDKTWQLLTAKDSDDFSRVMMRGLNGPILAQNLPKAFMF